MDDHTANDAPPSARLQPDAHGEAAMLLVESMIHGLIAHSAITTAQAVEIVDIAAETKAEIDADLGDTEPRSRSAADILDSISRSLKADLPD
jgi:hypothetical protein